MHMHYVAYMCHVLLMSEVLVLQALDLTSSRSYLADGLEFFRLPKWTDLQRVQCDHF